MLGKLKDAFSAAGAMKQAYDMQKKMTQIQSVGRSSNGVITITINGQFDIIAVNVLDNTQYNKVMLEKSIKEAFNDAQVKLKKILAENFKDLMNQPEGK